MAGLSVLLESQNNNTTNFPKRPQILCKTTILRNPSLSSPYLPTSPFLEHCYLCRRRLVEGKDIYMYRGDRAFCSVECRCRQMYMDEAATAAAGEGGRRREGFGVLGM